MTTEANVVFFCIFLFMFGITFNCYRWSKEDKLDDPYIKIAMIISLVLTIYFGIVIYV